MSEGQAVTSANAIPFGPLDLTEQQRRVVRLLGRGRTYKDVADEMGISVHTVGAHASSAYRRLNVFNIREAVRVLDALNKSVRRRIGMLPPPLFPNETLRYTDSERRSRKAHSQRHRARKLGAPGAFAPQEWLTLCETWQHRCAYCGKKVSLEADHRVPLSRGGSNDITNILPACRPCNGKKGAKTEDEFRAERSNCP